MTRSTSLPIWKQLLAKFITKKYLVSDVIITVDLPVGTRKSSGSSRSLNDCEVAAITSAKSQEAWICGSSPSVACTPLHDRDDLFKLDWNRIGFWNITASDGGTFRMQGHDVHATMLEKGMNALEIDGVRFKLQVITRYKARVSLSSP